jgi:hypothetical protein
VAQVNDESARVTEREWQVHIARVGHLEDRIDNHDAGMREMVAVTVEEIMRKLPVEMELATERTLRRFQSDPEFWRGAVRQMSIHASEQASAWVGGRILLLLAGGLLAWGIAWLVKTGQIK